MAMVIKFVKAYHIFDSRAHPTVEIHGVLNTVSWGILLLMGAIIARYLKTFKSADPAWFYLHVSCQVIGYGVGVAGWVTGLDLGKKSKGVQYTTHRNIGITLFCLGTLQRGAAFCVRGGIEREKAVQYFKRRECEYDLKSSVDFYKEEDPINPAVTGILVFTSTPDKVSNMYYLGPAPLEEMAWFDRILARVKDARDTYAKV